MNHVELLNGGTAAPGSAPARRARVGFVNTHPIQYAAPLYAYINRSADIEPVALYLTDFSLRGAVDWQFGQKVVWDIDLLSGYEHHFVGSDWSTAHPAGFFSLRGSGLWKAISEARLDAIVIHGHNNLASLVAVAAARAHKVPAFYKAETHLRLPRGSFKRRLRPLILKSLFSQFSGFLAIGSLNREFYRSLGIPERKISLFPYAVDNDRFFAASHLSEEARARKRLQLGLAPDRPAFVYASKFLPRKHPDDLIRAGQQLARQGLELQLLMVGTGEMEPMLRELAAAEPRLQVTFTGFVNQAELPSVLAAADVFVLPSEDEPFGLIINEAMCAGLPVLASDEIGATADLVKGGVNGFTFDARDVDGLAAAMRPLVEDLEMRSRFAEESRRIIRGWSYEEDLQGLRQALHRVVPGALRR